MRATLRGVIRRWRYQSLPGPVLASPNDRACHTQRMRKRTSLTACALSDITCHIYKTTYTNISKKWCNVIVGTSHFIFSMICPGHLHLVPSKSKPGSHGLGLLVVLWQPLKHLEILQVFAFDTMKSTRSYKPYNSLLNLLVTCSFYCFARLRDQGKKRQRRQT